MQLEQERGQRIRADAPADRRPAPGDTGGLRGRVRLGLAGRAAGGLRLRGAPGAPAAVQGDRLGAAEERQGPARRSWPSCCGRTCCRRRGSPRRRSASSARCCGTGPGWSGCAPSSRTGSTRWWPISATTGPAATCPGPAAAGWPGWTCPPVSREIVTDCLAVIDGLAPLTDRIDGELRQHAKADPRVKTLTTLPGVGPVHRAGHAGRDRRHQPLPNARKLASWAGLTPTVRGSDLTVRHGHIPSRARPGCGGC